MNSLDEVSKLLEVFKKSEFKDIEFKKGDLMIRLSAGNLVAADKQKEKENEELSVVKDKPAKGENILVKAETVGTFYEAPSPGAEPFVKVGDKVQKRQQIGLIEVMKLFTPIEASINGIITEIHVQNATLVEYGEALFTITEVN